MFTVNHFIWLFISLVIIIVSVVLLNKYKPELNKVLSVAVIVAVLSEFTRAFSLMHLIPSTDGMMNIPFVDYMCSWCIYRTVYSYNLHR